MDLEQQYQDTEILAIAETTAALKALPNDESRRRVSDYLIARFLLEVPEVKSQVNGLQTPSPTLNVSENEALPSSELKGIAELTENGIAIVVPKLYAKNKLYAAIRLAKLTIYTCHIFTGNALSSRYGLTPLLKEWQLYDGNTRTRLANEPTIIRNGDELSLTPDGIQEVNQLIAEIRSPSGKTMRGKAFLKPSVEAKPTLQSGSVEPPQAIRYEHNENWENFTQKCAVGIHIVDKQGMILWTNATELQLLGYQPEEYIGHFVGDFHLEQPVVNHILGKLTRFETVTNSPARLRAKDGTIRYVMINSNVYRKENGEFGHTRCFTTAVSEAVWMALSLHG